MVKRRKRFILIIGIIIVSIIVLISIRKTTHNQQNTEHVKTSSTTTSPKPSVAKGTYSPHLKLHNNSYRRHLRAARSAGIEVIKSNSDINKYVRNGKLFAVRDGEGYKVQKLTHSRAVLNAKSLKMLHTIGKQFYADTDGKAFFTVTSMTRTMASQQKLTKHNVNAIRGISTHCFGASFDISYMRFNGVKEWNDPLKVKLQLILAKLQKEKKIFVVREKRSACYHITAR